jgi:hypothetical protein
MEAFLSRTPVFLALLGLLVLATLGLLVVSPPLAPVPVLLAGALWWVCRAPLRPLVLGLLAVAFWSDLVPEVPYEGHWKSPLYWPGKLLFTLPGMRLPLLDLAVLGLLALSIYRRATGQKVDPPPLSLPKPLVWTLLLVPATVLWLQVWGIHVNGGVSRVAQWQWHQMMMIPLMVWLFSATLRVPEDLRAVARILIIGCFIKAFLGAFFVLTMARPRALYHEYATTHSDTLLYVTGLMVVVTAFMERPERRPFWRMLGVGALILMGMHYNDRRLAYASFNICMFACYFISPWSWVKRYATRVGIVLLPLMPLYLGVGWQEPTGIFKPVGIFKSLLEGEAQEPGQMDYRDMENFNVISTWQRNPVLGTGWGHPFDEVMKLPDISHAFEDYLYHPHNSVLGLLAFGGVVGLSGLWLFLAVTVFLAVRAYHRAHPPEQRAAGLVVVSIIVAYTNQCFGDMGSISWLGTLLIALAVTCAGQLALLTGAWPSPTPATGAPGADVAPVGNPV